MNIPVQSRRRLFVNAGTIGLSATAIALLAGCDSMAQGTMAGGTAKKANPASDVATLNVALGLEYEAITAYQLGAESGLLSQSVLPVAVMFQTHHKEHAAALEATIARLGGKPVAMKSKADYAAGLGAASLKTQGDVLMLAARLERGAANAYLGVIPSFGDPDLAKIAGRLAADETMHWTALTSALGQALPAKALSFGA